MASERNSPGAMAAPMAREGSVTDDRVLGGRVLIRQAADGYRAAIDPVLLAAAAQPSVGARVLDAGCGSGAALFCLAARLPAVHIVGLERDDATAHFARDGIALNGCVDRVTIVTGTLAQVPDDLRDHFDVVITNPPFTAEGTPPPNAAKAAAHLESDLDLTAWVKACLSCLKSKGRLVMVHRADRLSELLTALRGAAGDIHILPIHARADEPARRVIVDAGKGRRSPDTLLPGFILHTADGQFTAAADAVLRDAAALPMTAR